MKLSMLPLTITCIMQGHIMFAYDKPENTPWIKALAMIESGDRGSVIGKKGEVSRYQIMPSVWKSINLHPYSVHFWTPTSTSAQVAYIHMSNYSAVLGNKYNRRPTAAEFYCAWNLGITKFGGKYKFEVDKCPLSVRNRAYRFRNLVELYVSKN